MLIFLKHCPLAARAQGIPERIEKTGTATDNAKKDTFLSLITYEPHMGKC